MEFVENRVFDEIKIGDIAKLERTLTEQDIRLFAVMSGDINPAHVDPEYAMSSRFREVIGHGMWSGASDRRADRPNGKDAGRTMKCPAT